MSAVIKFGHVTYETGIPIMDEFISKLLEDKLVASECECGQKFLPPRSGCNKCYRKNMKLVEIKPEATLKAFTVIHFAPESLADKAPYIAAIGEFEEGLQLLAHLVGVTSMPTVGMKMKLVSQKLSSDRVVYKFTKL
jgi:uncharacterized OB-fold protein